MSPIVEMHQNNLTVAIPPKNRVEQRNLTAVHSRKISVCPITSHKMRLQPRMRRMQHQVDKRGMLPILPRTLPAIPVKAPAITREVLATAHMLRRGTVSQSLESLIRRQESPRPVQFH